MKESMNMFNLVSGFWRMAEEERPTPSEAALYFFLLHRANTQKWRMPIRCPTSTICAFLSTSKQNVMKAREGLSARGLITFTPGSGTNEAPLYTLTEINDQLSGRLSGQLSGQLSGRLSGQLSHYNIEDKDKEKDNYTITACKKSVLGLEELKKVFLEDEQWQDAVLSFLLARNIKGADKEILRDHISQFFLYLRTTGVAEKDTNDCKTHFVNWLQKQLLIKTSDKNYDSNKQDRRKTGDVGSVATPSYYEPF